MAAIAWRMMLAPFALLALAACGDGGADARPAQPLGLHTSLPILWPESGELAGLLDADAPRHWALDVLERHGRLQPLDTLAPRDGGGLPLPRGGLLVLAQPRPLLPEENVALDDWLRSGGRLLLFADPMLTEGSDFAPGDQRRPQDVVLLSPILSRWGLELQFDDEQAPGERIAGLMGKPVPVNLPGSFRLSGNSRECAILAAGLAARCRIGEGLVLAVADAALLEAGQSQAIPIRAAALEALIASLESGETRD